MSRIKTFPHTYTATRTDEVKSDLYGTSSADSVQKTIWSDVVFYGDNVPNWRYYLTHGGGVVTTLSADKYWRDGEGGFVRAVFKRKNPGAGLENEFTLVSKGNLCAISKLNDFGGASMTTANNQAISKFLSHARQAQTRLQGIVVAGELAKTLQMIRSPLKSLRSGLGDYLSFVKKRRHNLKPSQKRKFLSETWLEYSYGFKPLMNDVKGAAEAAAAAVVGITRESEFIRGYGKAEAIRSGSGLSYDSQNPNGDLHWSWTVTGTDVAEIKYYGVVKCLPASSSGFNNQNLGFDIQDWAPSIWELIPYSFLVDYFTNVGDIISAYSFWTSAIQWVGKGEKKSTHLVIGDQRVFTANDYSSPQQSFRLESCDGNPGRGGWHSEQIFRTAYIGALIPSFEMRVPGDTSLKWLNIAALGRTHASLIPF